MIIFGASGHGKVIYNILIESNDKVSHFFDDNKSLKTFIDKEVTTYDPNYLKDEELIIAVGNNVNRYQISKRIKHNFGIAIHPSAIISKDVIIERGTVVMHAAIIQTGSIIGKHVIINTAASVDHDCKIADLVHISPNSTLCGNVKVGFGSHIGAGSVINPNITIGKWCIIGSGAVIIRDIPDYAIVVGNPGKIIKYNLIDIDEK